MKTNTTALKTIKEVLKDRGKEGVPAAVIARAFKLNPKVARARLRRHFRREGVSERNRKNYAVNLAEAQKFARLMGAAA